MWRWSNGDAVLTALRDPRRPPGQSNDAATTASSAARARAHVVVQD